MEDNSDKKSDTKKTLIEAAVAGLLAALGVFLKNK